MRLIVPAIPTYLNARIIGQLVASDDVGDLSEDMIDVLLPSGVAIHAGWYPDSDPSGEYRVFATRGLSSVSSTLPAKTADQAASDIAMIASLLSIEPVQYGAGSAGSVQTIQNEARIAGGTPFTTAAAA